MYPWGLPTSNNWQKLPNKTTKKDSGTKEAQNKQNTHQTVLEYKLQLLTNINTVHQFEKVYHTNPRY